MDRAHRACSRSRSSAAGYGLHVPPMFEHYEVFARVGESTDIVQKEMYDVRGPRRATPGAAARGDGLRRSRLRRAPADDAVEGLVRGAELPGRGAPGGSVPPAPPGRRRGARVDGSGLGRRGDRTCSTASSGRSGLRQYRLLLNSLGDPASRATYLDVLRRFLEDHSGELSAQARADARGESAARPRLEAQGRRGGHRGRAPDDRPSLRRGRRALRTSAVGPARRRRRVRDRTAAGARARLLHAHDVRVRRRFARLGAERRSVAAVGTTCWPSRWADRRRPASASDPASSARCSRATPRVCFRRPTSTRRRVRRGRGGRHPRARADVRAARCGRPRRPRLRPALA